MGEAHFEEWGAWFDSQGRDPKTGDGGLPRRWGEGDGGSI